MKGPDGYAHAWVGSNGRATRARSHRPIRGSISANLASGSPSDGPDPPAIGIGCLTGSSAMPRSQSGAISRSLAKGNLARRPPVHIAGRVAALDAEADDVRLAVLPVA